MIKYISLALFIAAVSAAPHKSVDFACPEEDIAATSCMGEKDCLYPHPERCDQFIHCEVNADNRTGRPTVKDCPAGLEWNDRDKICDWPASSTCGKGSTAAPTTEPSTAEPSTAEPSTARPSSAQPSTAQPSTGAPSTEQPSTEQPASTDGGSGAVTSSRPDNVCSEEEIAATGCKGPKDCLYPNPDNCNSFLQCTVNADNKTGTPVVMPCPEGLEWNDIGKICDRPANSTCSNKGSTAGVPSTAEPSTAQPSSVKPSTAEPSTSASSTSAPSTEQPASSSTDGGSGAESTARPNNVCSEEEIAATGCKGPKDCLYPNPGNCNSFLQCTVNADNKTGTPVVMPCPEGLEWNDNGKICDWPANSTCSNKGSTAGVPSTAEPSTAQPSTAQPSSAEPSTAEPSTAEPSTAEPSTAEPSTSAPSTSAPSTEQPASSSTDGGSGAESTARPNNVCSEEEIAATGCKGPKDCLYPNPDNCNSFIQCTVNADNKTGTPVVMPCPDGLEWNDNEKICDWPSSSTCNKGSTAASSSTATPGQTTSQSTTVEQSTPSPTTEGSTPAETTSGGSGGETNPPPTDTTTGQPETTTEQAVTTTTQSTQSSTLPACKPEDDDNDSNLDLDQICGNGCNSTRTKAHPSNNGKYIICSSTNSVEKCAPGLLYSKDKVSCTYAGLVDSNGPSSRS